MAELIPVAPEVLVWARQSALASVVDAAERTGRESQTILDWEAGRDRPTYGQLERLADEYGVSVNALLLPAAPPTPESPPDFRSPSQARESISRTTRRELRRARYLQSLLGEVKILPVLALPSIKQGQDAGPSLRHALGVSMAQQLSWTDANMAFREWRAALNGLGILVLQQKLPLGELLGLSLPAANGGPPVVLINQGDWINARIFTLLHELGHLVLARDGGICDPWRQGSRLSSQSLEGRCNRFAGSVLVPGEHLREQSEVLQVAAESDDAAVMKLLTTLGNRYRVSSQVIWYRIHELGLVSASVFHALWPRLRPPVKIRRPMADFEERKGLPRWKMASSRYGSQLLGGLLGAVDRGSLEPTQVMRALNLGTGDIARLQNTP